MPVWPLACGHVKMIPNILASVVSLLYWWGMDFRVSGSMSRWSYFGKNKHFYDFFMTLAMKLCFSYKMTSFIIDVSSWLSWTALPLLRLCWGRRSCMFWCVPVPEYLFYFIYYFSKCRVRSSCPFFLSYTTQRRVLTVRERDPLGYIG